MYTPREILDRITQYLSDAMGTGRLVLSRNERDGRVNSQENERQISHALELFALSNEWFRANGLQLEVAPPRHWYDFSLTGSGDLFLPVNVKVSALRTSDNISSKEGVFYALTGIAPDEVQINTWERFCEQLAIKIGADPAADYYFLVVGKETPGDVFWTSLKGIKELVPNGNNPPFQCNWGRNRTRTDRSQDAAQCYVLSILQETFRLRAEAFRSFNLHLNHFLQTSGDGY